MKFSIVHSLEPMALVGGANLSTIVLNNCLSRTDSVVAADGGADILMNHGVQPAAIIGDLDSISESARKQFAAHLHAVDDQDTTDFEKALAAIDAPLILAAGFLGGRLDHTLAVLNTLVRRSAPVVLVSDDDVVFAIRNSLTLHLPIDTRIALLPMSKTKVTTTGLHWNLTAATMHPAAQISSSNAVADGTVTITSNQPIILTLPLAQLDHAIAAVRAQ